MTPRPTPPRYLTSHFHKTAMRTPRSPMFIDQRPVCWLAGFDTQERPCEGKWEAVHMLGRQEVRNSPAFYGMDPELVELAEWDDRNATLGCEGHHRRFDSHMTPKLVVCRENVPAEFEDYVTDWGLESLAERKFPLAPLSPA